MAARQQNLYQIYKLTSTFICDNNLDIKNYTKKKAIQDGCLVSIGDNILFDRIRFARGDKRDYKKIFGDINFLRSILHKCKKENKIVEAKVVNQKIIDTLFVKDIINVFVVKKQEYRRLAKNGFSLNGIKYIRWGAGAGQIRRNTATFISEDLYDVLYKMLMCGIDSKVKEINLAKLSAYFALSFSSILWVDTPRCCVIKDFNTVIPKQKVDWICTNQETGEKYIEERIIDIELNSADGQGLIDPTWANHWADNMGLDYTPSSFVVRSCFIKGNLVPFDFKEYAKVNNIETITDRWGNEYNINDIDVILSESQFKMYKYYTSWQEYIKYTTEGGIKWGVARYNRKYDEENILTNYQYIQVLNLTKDEIHELVKPTIDWLQKICSGNELYSLLYSLGGANNDTIDYRNIYGRAQNLAMKAVVKNSDFLQDTYVQRKIYRNIIESINRAKLGKIWVRGNYQFCISDPIAQCRSALGLSPDGEIPADHVYSNFWNERNVTGVIDICRSPMIDKHEHNPSTLYKSSEADYWYKYIKSGVIFSIYDTAVCREEDSDFDGDIILSTDNKYFIKGSSKESNVIMYDKKPAPSHKITLKNFVETDIRGFGTSVGSFSNTATIIETMKPLFKDEYIKEELQNRKKILREIVGNEIDRIKGLAKPNLPPSWKKFEKINEDDSDIVKSEKYKNNSMVISKKPYFFRYLYPELNKKYKQYENSYNEISKCIFGIKFKKLLTKEDKNDCEKNLIRRYHRYCPLIPSNCTMNILCREFENVDFDIQYNKNNVTKLPDFSNEFVLTQENKNKFKELYRKYCNKKSIEYVTSLFDDEHQKREMRFNVFDATKEEIKEDIEELNLSPKEIISYIHDLSHKYTKFNWSFAWDILENDILKIITEKETKFPIRCEPNDIGSVEYLGNYYKLQTISKEQKQSQEWYDPNLFEDEDLDLKIEDLNLDLELDNNDF